MATESFELKFADWRIKVCEKLTFILIKINDGVDLSEDDEALLKELFKIWYSGSYPIYANRLKGTDEMAEQGGLFGDLVSHSDNGMAIDSSSSELKK